MKSLLKSFQLIGVLLMIKSNSFRLFFNLKFIFQANEYESSAICSRDSESSETINGNCKFRFFYVFDQLIILY